MQNINQYNKSLYALESRPLEHHQYMPLAPEISVHQSLKVQQKKLPQAQNQNQTDYQQEHSQCQIDKMSQVVSVLLSKNKINARNAFQVPLVDVRSLRMYRGHGDGVWTKISETLGNSSRVYGYRVDSMSQNINKMTNYILRNLSKDDSQQSSTTVNRNTQTFSFSNKPSQIQLYQLQTHLDTERLQENQLPLIISRGTTDCKTRRLMDQNGLAGLLLGLLPISRDLFLRITQQKQEYMNKQIDHVQLQKNKQAYKQAIQTSQSDLNITQQITSLFKSDHLPKTEQLYSNIHNNTNSSNANKSMVIDDQYLSSSKFVDNDGYHSKNDNCQSGQCWDQMQTLNQFVSSLERVQITFADLHDPQIQYEGKRPESTYSTYQNSSRDPTQLYLNRPQKLKKGSQNKAQPRKKNSQPKKPQKQTKKPTQFVTFSADTQLQKQQILKPGNYKKIIKEYSIKLCEKDNLFDSKLAFFQRQCIDQSVYASFSDNQCKTNPLTTISILAQNSTLQNVPQIFHLESQLTAPKQEQHKNALIRQNKQQLQNILCGLNINSQINFSELFQIHKKLKIQAQTMPQQAPLSEAIDLLSVLHLCNELGFQLKQLTHQDFRIVRLFGIS